MNLGIYQVDCKSIHLGNRRNEVRDKLLESIEEDLSLSYVILEMSTVFNRITTLEEPNVFYSELENLFGAGARGIENLIVEQFYEKTTLRMLE